MSSPLPAFTFLSDRHREVTDRLHARAADYSQRGRAPSRRALEAYLAATYDLLCAPPGATVDEHEFGAWLCLVVFKADDAPTDELAAFLARPAGAPATTELAAAHDDLLSALAAAGRDTAALRSSLHTMVECMLAERTLDRASLDESHYWRLRHHTVGGPAYVAVWAALRDLSFPPSARPQQGRADRLASALLSLTNDLASLARDDASAARGEPDDLNLVRLRTRRDGSRPAALARTLAEVRDTAGAFTAACDALTAAGLAAYAELLRALVRGNLAALEHLEPLRYAGARALLEPVHAALAP